MEIDSTRVSPGMLPPIIRMTPNSPSVCAKVSAMAETMPGQASGSSMRRIVSQRDRPLTKAASRTFGGMASNARWIGCTANGRLMISEATRMPAKLNTSWPPNTDLSAPPKADCGEKARSR